MRCEIAFGVDANYVKYAGIVMTSAVLQNAGEAIGFHLVCDGITEADCDRLEDFRRIFPSADIHIYDARAIRSASGGLVKCMHMISALHRLPPHARAMPPARHSASA